MHNFMQGFLTLIEKSALNYKFTINLYLVHFSVYSVYFQFTFISV